MEQSKFIEKIDKLVALQSNYRNILEGNEAQTRWLLIDSMILDLWGYSREDVVVEYSVDSDDRVSVYPKLDYCVVLNNKPKLLIEAKSLGVDLYSKFSQLAYYFSNINLTATYEKSELIGVLTDGDLYLFYTDSKEQGTLDSEPFLTVRLSCSEDYEILKMLPYNKEYIANKSTESVIEPEEFDLSTYYRIDMIERIFNYYESLGTELSIGSVYIGGKLRKISSLRTLYRELLKEVNILQPHLLFELAAKEGQSKIEGSIIDNMFSIVPMSNSIEVKTQSGIIYVSLSRTRKGLIDRVIYLLKHSSIGLFNVTVKLIEHK